MAKLTLKVAQILVRRELGVPPKLSTTVSRPGMQIYEMQLGRLTVQAENDWYEHNDRYVLTISADTGDDLVMYYRSDTLDQDYAASDKRRQEIRMEYCIGCDRAK